MRSRHLFATYSSRRGRLAGVFERSRHVSGRLDHLIRVNDTTPSGASIEPVLTLAQLAEQLGVTVQTLYDLRLQGRGLRCFRVGRELRVRVGEVDAWLRRLEEDDAADPAAEVGDGGIQ